MDSYVDYESFPNFELASELISILDNNNIPYQIDDSALRYKLVASIDSPLNQVIIKVREKDIEKLNLLNSDRSDVQNGGHYLYTFSDKDIIDVIANPDEWTPQEQLIAKTIIKQRNISITASNIKEARKDIVKPDKVDINKLYKSISNWFFLIAILSMLNTILIGLKWNVNFLLGLGFTQLIDSVFLKLYSHLNAVTVILSFIFPGLFFILWYYTKKNTQWPIITGLILYSFDSIVLLLLKYWAGFGFHLFILLIIIGGYDKIIKETKKNVA